MDGPQSCLSFDLLVEIQTGNDCDLSHLYFELFVYLTVTPSIKCYLKLKLISLRVLCSSC